MTEINMTLSNITVLFSILLIGGLIPSVSSLAVLSRSSTLGFVHGAFTIMGIILGDITFILLAIFGLALLAQSSGSLFVVIKFLGAAYLIWLGTIQWQTELQSSKSKKIESVSLLSSFLTGLFITLADQKAILFYLAFFPALFELSKITIIGQVLRRDMFFSLLVIFNSLSISFSLNILCTPSFFGFGKHPIFSR